MRFKPADLLPDPSPPLLLEPQRNAVQLTAAAREVLRQRAGEPVFVRAAAEALQVRRCRGRRRQNRFLLVAGRQRGEQPGTIEAGVRS